MTRVSIPKHLQYKVWCRDNWRCVYCQRGVIFSPTLKELEHINPGKGVYDQHGSHSRMLALFENLWACCDHKIPVARGGTNVLENLVTSCFACNRAKGDSGDFKGVTRAGYNDVPETWDGMLGLYVALSKGDTEWGKIINAATK